MSFGMMYGNHYTDENGNKQHASINGERFVYYKRLNTDKFENKEFQNLCRKIYGRASELVRYRFSVAADTDNIAEYFRDLRDKEYYKEIRLLEDKLGKTFTKEFGYDYDNENAGKVLIEGINELLNFKDVFNRNMKLITDTKGQKQLITFFSDYFDKQFRAHKEEIVNEITTRFKQTNDFENSVRETFEKWIPDLVRNALIYMFTEAKAENGLPKGEFDDAYKELAKYLEKGNSAGDTFVKNIMESYGLEDIMSKFEGMTSKNYKSKIKKTSFKLGKYQMMSKGGSASEDFGTFAADIVGNEILKLNNTTKMSAVKTGATKQKADFMISYDIEPPIEEWLEENSFGTRDKDTAAMYGLQKTLESISNGFLVMANAKNYTLNKDFKSRGFSAGEKINLETWDTMMHNMHTKGRDLIFMALQTIPKAVGEKEKDNVSNVFARAIGAALFDDINIVGKTADNEPGAKTIHVLYLNGIYLPLSFYFNLLYRAFHDYSKAEVSKLVTVNIHTPGEILWPTQKKEQKWIEQHPNQHPWNYQSRTALRETTVEYHFLRAFQDEMKKLNLKL